MYSRAVWPRLRASLPSLPGTVITRLSPSTTTSEPDTPRPLTRALMISCAWSSASRVGREPSGVRAVSVTRVPPCRSMPSFGSACLSPVRKTRRYTPISMIKNNDRYRNGCTGDDDATVLRSPRGLFGYRAYVPQERSVLCEAARLVHRGGFR